MHEEGPSISSLLQRVDLQPESAEASDDEGTVRRAEAAATEALARGERTRWTFWWRVGTKLSIAIARTRTRRGTGTKRATTGNPALRNSD